MNPQAALDLLLASDDREVCSVGKRLQELFGSTRRAPSASILTARKRIAADVQRFMPTPFAEQYRAWTRNRASFVAAVRAHDEEGGSEHWRAAFLNLYDCWLQILRFTPFIFLSAANRLREPIQQHAQVPFAKALVLYAKRYLPAEGGRQTEADQRDLLGALLDVFRVLDAAGALDERFVFAPLLRPAGSFEALFPRRFEAELLALQVVRNDLTHRYMEKRPNALLLPMESLIARAFIDLVDRLLQISCDYAIGFTVALAADDATNGAELLMFDGADGPRLARATIESTPRSEAERFTAQRLYLLRRAALAGAGLPLQPKDYLDLTPFLISELIDENVGGTRNLFALDLYLRAELRVESKLLFREFASETTFPSMKRAPSEKIRRLIKAVEDFDLRTKSFCPDVRAGGNDAGWDAVALRAKFWDASGEHLTTVLDAACYDDGGKRRPELTPSKAATYDDAVFVAPPESPLLDAFFDDPAGGVLLVGPSGLGKSTVLCDTYLKRLRAGDFALFLTGRHLRYAALDETLDYLILRGMRRDKMSLASFERFLAEAGKSLVVFIDAVNEYTGDGGAAALLESVVDFVQNQRLRGVRVVASCRSETWARYRERTRLQRPLAGAHFYTDDAIILTDFDDERLRAQLYSRYRAAYALAPDSYRQLGNGVKALVRTPLMMALIAQTYASKRVPVEVDYFALFEALTRRKLGDAQQFVSPDDPRSKYFQAEMRRGLERFTELLLERLRSPERLNGVRDALAIDVLAKDVAGSTGVSFAELMQGADDRLSVYEALLQTHLIEEVVVAERDSAGGDDEGHAVHFFHDQYAQYRLGLAYERADVLGKLDFDVLDDARALDDLTNRIAALVESSLQAPILAGALEHWLHAQLARAGDDAIEYEDVVPLLSRMAEHPASIVRDVARRIVTDFVLREVVPPQKLYEQSLRRGTPRLQRELASAYIDYWPGVPAETTRAFVAACGAADATAALERLAEVFSVHFGNERPGASAVLEHLSEVIPRLSPAMVFDVRRAKASSMFLVQFAQAAVVSQFGAPEKMIRLRDFVKDKAGLLIGVLTSRGGLAIAMEPVRQFLYRMLERTGVTIWNEAIGSQSGNDRFFVEADGMCQRDVLFEFFPYCVAMHNGELRQNAFAPGTEFRTLALKMLGYRVTSAVGYVAMATLTAPLADDWEATRDLVTELVATGSEASQFFGTLLLVNLCYANHANCAQALRFLAEDFVPRVRAGTARYDWVMHDCLGIVETDVAGLWALGEPVVSAVLDYVGEHETQERVDEFGHELAKASFFPDVAVGMQVVGILLERKLLRRPRWRTAVRRACAGLGVRSPSALQQLFDEHGISEDERRFVRAAVDDEVELQSQRFIVQTTWNRFVATALARIVTVRYLLLADLIGGLIQSNNVPEYAREFRRFVVDAVRAYLTDEGAAKDYAQMTVEDVYAATEAVRKPGSGEVWAAGA